MRLEPRSRFDRRLTDQLGELPAILAGATIIRIDTVGFERILRIALKPRGGDGEDREGAASLDLFFELVPRTPFVVLASGGAIVAAMRAPGTRRADDRRMVRGGAYLLPFDLGPPDRVPDAQNALETLFASSTAAGPEAWTKVLARRLRGVPPKRLAALVQGANNPAAAAAHLAGYLGPLAIEHDQAGSPVLVPAAGDFSDRPRPSAVAVAAEWARLQVERELARRLHAAIGRALRAERKRLDRSRQGLERDARQLGDAALLRRQGETILVHLAQVEAGARRTQLPDPYTGSLIEIELDPRRTAAANAEGYFQAARRAERAAAHFEARARALDEQVQALSAAETRLAASSDSADSAELRTIADLARELIAAGLVPGDVLRASEPPSGESETGESGRPKGGRSAVRRRGETQERLPYRAYPVGNGWEVWVGRSAADNDLLTHKLARPHDLWFHARGASGSHVVLRRIDGARTVPPPAVVEIAAAYAAYFSRASHSRLVPVIVTEKRYVQKPRRSPPGTAMCLREKVVMAVPRRPAGKESPKEEPGPIGRPGSPPRSRSRKP